jgi:aminoglycoside phosphotransferase (APT) family kinase protein
MEEEIERRCGLTELDPDTIGERVRAAFPGGSVRSARLVTEGKCNTNYRVEVSGRDEPVLLRLYARDPAACGKERDLYRLIRGRIPAPEMLYASPARGEGDRSYSLLSWVEGVPMDQWLPTAEPSEAAHVAREIGAAWAALRSFRFPRAGFFGDDLQIAVPFENAVDAYFDHMEECLFRGRAEERLGKDLARDLWALVREYRALLDGEKDARSLVHADFRPANMRVCEKGGKWELAAVLDWEFAHSGSGMGDLGQLFRFKELLPAGFEEGFVTGVTESGGGLPPRWKQMGKLMDAVHLCDLLNAPEDQPHRRAQVTKLVTETLEDWDTYA